jgi:molybdate transport system substrate-binding protein
MNAPGRFWRIPADLHPPLEQGGAVLSRAQDPVSARAFRDFLRGAEGAAILERNGFLRPER